MVEYTLILFLYAGMMSNSDSVALTNVPGFKSQAACEAAGSLAASKLSGGTFKSGKYVCVKSE
jgi:hypothetical protein